MPPPALAGDWHTGYEEDASASDAEIHEFTVGIGVYDYSLSAGTELLCVHTRSRSDYFLDALNAPDGEFDRLVICVRQAPGPLVGRKIAVLPANATVRRDAVYVDQARHRGKMFYVFDYGEMRF